MRPVNPGMVLREARRATGLGFIGELVSGLISAGTQFGLAIYKADQQRAMWSDQKKLESYRLFMDLQTHSLAVKEATLTLQDLEHKILTSGKVRDEQAEATIAGLDAQESAIKSGDWATAERITGLTRAQIASGAFDVRGREMVAQAKAAAPVPPWAIAGGLVVLALAVLR